MLTATQPRSTSPTLGYEVMPLIKLGLLSKQSQLQPAQRSSISLPGKDERLQFCIVVIRQLA